VDSASRRRRLLAAAGGLGLVVAAAALVAANDGRDDDGGGPAGRAVVVSARPVRDADGYAVTRSFVGRVEARRRSAVGFELAGTLDRVHVDEGDEVAEGELLAELDTDRLRARRDRLMAARERASAERELAEATLRRRRALFEGDAASAQGLDEAERSARTARAALREAEASVRSVSVDLEKSLLRAPYDARVSARRADEGQVLAAAEPVLELLERSAPEARIGVAGEATEALATGQRHGLRIRGRRFPATVRALLPVRERATRTVDVLLRLESGPASVRSGDLAALELQRRIAERGFWLPLEALTASARGLWACYVTEPLSAGAAEATGDGTHRLARRELEVLHQQGDRAFVRGTLSAGELVVVEGLHRLAPGLEVRLASDEPRVAGR